MLAQIKSSDEEVWESLRNSGHLCGNPSNSLVVRLTKMRNWIGGNHFSRRRSNNNPVSYWRSLQGEYLRGTEDFLEKVK